MNTIAKLMSTKYTVFDTQQIKKILSIPTEAGLYSFLQRAKKDGRLLNPQKGVWTLPSYDMNELAGKLFPGGYISLAPVLFQAGVSFQYYGNTIQCVWHKNADIFFNGQNYTAKVIKKDIYNNPTCIQKFDTYRKALPERALCDLVYLRPKANFDNPQYFQTKQSEVRLKQLLPLYPKATQENVRRIIAQQI